jgi:hypothetical protein
MTNDRTAHISSELADLLTEAAQNVGGIPAAEYPTTAARSYLHPVLGPLAAGPRVIMRPWAWCTADSRDWRCCWRRWAMCTADARAMVVARARTGRFICDLYSGMDGAVRQPAAASGEVVVAVVLA